MGWYYPTGCPAPKKETASVATELRPSVDAVLMGFEEELTRKQRDFIADQFCRLADAMLTRR